MNRLLLYVHYNKYNKLSSHVIYQLQKLAPLFSTILFISNSQLSANELDYLETEGLITNYLQRENIGFDFLAWREGMFKIGFDELKRYDSVTLMNDTCFGPLWDMESVYQSFENQKMIDFWGMTNHRATKRFKEHLQSYFISFKQQVVQSEEFYQFWSRVIDYSNVQDVIEQYETQITTHFLNAGYHYSSVFNTVDVDTTGMLHPDFSYYNPTAIIRNKVPFIKVKTIDANQHIAHYLLQELEKTSNYPLELIVSHMSNIHTPDLNYLLARKYVGSIIQPFSITKKVAVHLHVFYVDLLQEFLTAFTYFAFDYDLFITTDRKEKVVEIEKILVENSRSSEIVVTGNIGRDVLPMLKLKEVLHGYDYVGHFHTKKSKEADFWAGESWRKELIEMLVIPANTILANMVANDDVGLVIADIPTFFRFNKIVDAYNENKIAPIMNELWIKMGMTKPIDFNSMHTFVMSYGTFVWFKYDALKPLFDLNLTDADVPAEPLPQNSVLHAIERLLVYIAWNQQYDFRISKNPTDLTTFIDNKLLNLREDALPHTYVNFDQLGGIKGAIKYIFVGPLKAIKYILKRVQNELAK